MSPPNDESTPVMASQANNLPTYVSVTKESNKPTGDQAILLDRIAEGTHEDYIHALLKVIPLSKIKCTDVINNRRILVWLDSKSTVDELINAKKSIIVSQQIIYIRPYVIRNTRILFTHCFPQVNNSFLEQELNRQGIEILAPIKTLKCGFKDKSLAGIDSLKRDTFIAPEDVYKLPHRIEVKNIEGKSMSVSVVVDGACYYCRKEGHNFAKCPVKNPGTERASDFPHFNPSQEPKDLSAPPSSTVSPSVPSTELIPRDAAMVPDPVFEQLIPAEQESASQAVTLASEKRALSPSTSSTTDVSGSASSKDDHEMNNDLPSGPALPGVVRNFLKESSVKIKSTGTIPKQPLKKLKTTATTSRTKTAVKSAKTQDKWKRIQDLIDSNREFPLNFEQFVLLIDKTKNPVDIVSNAQEFTNDLEGVRLVFDYVRNSLPTKTLKKLTAKIITELDEFNSVSTRDDQKDRSNMEVTTPDIIETDSQDSSEDDEDEEAALQGRPEAVEEGWKLAEKTFQEDKQLDIPFRSTEVRALLSSVLGFKDIVPRCQHYTPHLDKLLAWLDYVKDFLPSSNERDVLLGVIEVLMLKTSPS